MIRNVYKLIATQIFVAVLATSSLLHAGENSGADYATSQKALFAKTVPSYQEYDNAYKIAEGLLLVNALNGLIEKRSGFLGSKSINTQALSMVLKEANQALKKIQAPNAARDTTDWGVVQNELGTQLKEKLATLANRLKALPANVQAAVGTPTLVTTDFSAAATNDAATKEKYDRLAYAVLFKAADTVKTLADKLVDAGYEKSAALIWSSVFDITRPLSNLE